MSGTQIGEVSINLRMNLVQLNKDVKDGAGAVGSAAKQLGSTMRDSSMQGREALMLLGEEIGVHIPRGIRSMLADLPGIGGALSAAFSSVAVIALLEVVAKIVEKIQEWKKQIEEAKAAWTSIGEEGRKALRSQEEEIIALQDQLDELTGDHLSALRGELKLIDMQKFDHLTKQLEDLKKSVDAAFDKSKLSAFSDFFHDSNQYIDEAKTDFDALAASVKDMSNAGNDTGIASALAEKVKELNRNMALPAAAQNREVRVKAFQDELNAVTQLQKQYTHLNTIQDDQKGVKLQEQRIKDEGQLQEILDLRDKEQAKLNTTFQTEIQSYDEAIRKMQEYKANWEAAHGGVSVIANQAIEALQKQKAAIEANIAALQHMLAMGVVPGATQKAPDLTEGTAMPGFGGTSSELQLAKLKTDSQAAAAEAMKVRDTIESQNQKFKDQAAILQYLKSQGLLTEQQFQAAMQKAAADTDKADKQWTNFGQAVGQDIEQTILFHKSWSDAIKAIITQVIALIIQMTLLKKLQSSLGGGTGAGGFFSGLLGGLFGGHKASGGYVDSSHAYVVGENGPELFSPNGSGSIIPNGALQAGGVHAEVNYNIDARGADAGVEQRLRAAIKESEGRAVAKAVVTSQEISKRRLS